MTRRSPKGKTGKATRKGGGSAPTVSPPPGFRKSEWTRLAAFAAAATKLRRSQAQKAVWARRKAAAAEEAVAKEQVAALRAEEQRVRAEVVAEAKRKLAQTLSEARTPKPKRAPRSLQERAARQRQQILQKRKIEDALENVEIAAAGGTSEEKAALANVLRSEVTLGREAMEARLLQFYGQQVSAGKVREIKPGRKPGVLYKRSGPVHEGFIKQKRVGKLLSQMSREEIAAAASKIAEKLRKRQPQGKLFASISFFEYGRGKPGYYTVGQDELGTYVQSFDAIGNPLRDGKLDSVDAFEGRLRELLLQHSTEHNAVLLDTIEVKTFREKTEEERKAYSHKRYLKRKARIAAKKASK